MKTEKIKNMKLSEIVEKLNLHIINSANMEAEINDAYASDLLSDVMGKAKSGQIWITLQTHKNVAAIASLKDLPAVVITGNGKPDDDMLAHAVSEGICVLGASELCYQVCGKLYNLLNSEA